MHTLFRVMVVAQQGLMEAFYNRTYLLLSIVIIVCASIGMFAGELVLSGTDGTRLVVYNFTVRLSLVSIIAIYTIQSLIREKADKQTDLILALDMPRELYILGRLAGFVFIIGIAGILTALFPLWYINAGVTLIWAASLMAELSIVVCLSIFVAISISNTAVCFSIVMGTYLLARNMGNLLLLSQSTLLQGQGVGLEWIRIVLDGINLLLPDLWLYAQSDWLLGTEINPDTVISIILSSIVFCSLLIAASAIDLHRKSL